MSLWSVEGRATSILMTRFYQNLARQAATSAPGSATTDRDVAGALHEARVWMRERRDTYGARPYANPTYWAGFVVFGGANAR